MPCRHRNTWLICGGTAEWCYECGAFRNMRMVNPPTLLSPSSCWQRPVGIGGESPHESRLVRNAAWRKRYLKEEGK